MNLIWQKIQPLPSRAYECGYCGASVASALGWSGQLAEHSAKQAFLYVCHLCSGPTFFPYPEGQLPAIVFGSSVADIPDAAVSALYEEARRATGAGAYTAAVLCCRKLLMHIAVSKGAPDGKSFVTYVEYLADSHYVPPDARGWVDHIRKKGNEANHEIVVMDAVAAQDLLTFIEMLLRVIFEFPAAVRRRAGGV